MGSEFDISGITGASDKKSFSIQNNYRFDALIRAIDFFSQKFNMETLVDFAGDFINEILTLSSSAVFVYDKSGDCFQAAKIRLYDNDTKMVRNSKKLQDIARLYGTIITSNFHTFFPEKFIEAYKPDLLIPLIHNNGLLGFIVTDGKVIGEFDEDDYSMAKALMRLSNSAFERNFHISELEECNKRIDKLAFELYSANTTSGILFNEINPDKLLGIGLDVFSEVSGSRTTSFALLDDNENALVVKAFKDNTGKAYESVGSILYFLDNPKPVGEKKIFAVSSDLDELEALFKNPEVLQGLNAEYIVLIVRERIYGFVTLGNVKTSANYSNETLDIVSTLSHEVEFRYRNLTDVSV